MRAVFLDRDGTITKSTHLVTDVKDLELEEAASEGISAMNRLGMKVIVITNQPQVARGLCTEADVERLNKKMVDDLAKHGAHVDAVYYCPHHPEMHHDVPPHALKYRFDCECRKPKAGMLQQAAAEHGINLSESFMIGDRTVDILAGKNAGCRTILVKTGRGGLDKKHDVAADHEAADLSEAAKIIAGRKVNAVILAGGKGERLSEMTRQMPKPMISIGGKPVVEHQIELMKKNGITDIVLCGSYLIDKIKEYFGDGSGFGVKISYTDEPEPMGTGGALKLAGDFLEDTFILMNGDIMVKDLGLREIIEFHRRSGALVTMILRETDHPKDSDVVKLGEGGRVVEFIGKGQEACTTGNTGIFIANRRLLGFVPPGKSNIEKDVLAKIFGHERVFGFKIKEGWIAKDMGTPDRLESLRRIFGD